jgi:phenylalanyl-tRNA synthetase beta chain
MNNSLTRSAYNEGNTVFPAEQSVRILNPLSRDLDVLRQTLLYGGLETVVYNQNRKINDVKIFEFGTCYTLLPAAGLKNPLEKYHEEKHLAILLTGKMEKENWITDGKMVSIYDLKLFVNNLLMNAGLELSSIGITDESSGVFSEGLNYQYEKEILVSFGRLSTTLLKQFDCSQEVYYAEIHWDTLLRNLKTGEKQVREIPKFPEVRRDLALLLDRSVTFSEIEKLAFATEKSLLREVGLFDVYEGEKIEEGKKSYAVYFILQDEQKTLTDEGIENVMSRLKKIFEQKLSARIR